MTTPAPETPPAAAPGAPPAAETAPAAVPTPPAAPAATPSPAKPSLEDTLAPLDDEARKFVMGEVTKARQEAASSRTTAKKTAADEARAELAQQIGKALGLVEDEATDPAKLTEQLTAQTAQARQAQVELAVYRAAGTEFDPAALLDSRSFAASLKDVDPSDHAAVLAAINTAAAANPGFKVGPQRRLPGPPVPPGSAPPDLETQIAAAQKAGDIKTVIHLQNQKLAAPQPH